MYKWKNVLKKGVYSITDRSRIFWGLTFNAKSRCGGKV